MPPGPALRINSFLGGETVPDKIEALAREIRKIERRVTMLKKEMPASTRERKIQEATLSLLGNVLNDLREQQKNLTQPEKEENAQSGQK